MPIKDRSINIPPEKPDGEGWLANADQQKIVQFKPDAPTAHGQWVILRTFHWRPPDYPIPQTRRRMLRHNAIEAWQTMLKTGWRKCPPPIRCPGLIGVCSGAQGLACVQSSPDCRALAAGWGFAVSGQDSR